TIYNLFGQIVFNKTLANQGERRIQVQNLPRGIYYLELVQTEQKTVNRLILE
ncbi:MAG: T9SS type A sorting domain-containing protein, partial [Bacteroidia bacterium]|nr:T9SS type A sorting domain-containing protein [Bacteroidia bacterium]